MAGLGAAEPGARLVSGVIYQPYYVASLALAAGVTWLAPQSWNFTRRLDLPRAAWALALFWVACMMLFAQAFNPFIYFIF